MMKKTKMIVLGLWVVLAGLCVLAVIQMTRVSGSPSASSAVDQDLQSLENSLDHYQKIGLIYPSSEQGLWALVERPEAGLRPMNWEQTWAELPTDAWGSPYKYHYPGRVDPKKPEVVSAGPDRIFGTEDDVSNQSSS